MLFVKFSFDFNYGRYWIHKCEHQALVQAWPLIKPDNIVDKCGPKAKCWYCNAASFLFKKCDKKL
jgi:hypothetical protein